MRLTIAKYPRPDRLEEVERSALANLQRIQEQFSHDALMISDPSIEETPGTTHGQDPPPPMQADGLPDMPLPGASRTNRLDCKDTLVLSMSAQI